MTTSLQHCVSTADNAILAALPEVELHQLLPHLRPVTLQQGQILHGRDERPNGKVYFLTQGIAVLTVSTDQGEELELSMVGNEGIVGEKAIFEGHLFLVCGSMLTSGAGYMLPSDVFKARFHDHKTLFYLTMRSLEARLAETSQVALCGHMHPVEQRLCRWLLALADRLHSDHLPVTHERISRMLGLRRASITEVVSDLRNSLIVDSTRGTISIMNRAALEQRCCECYRVLKAAMQLAYAPPLQNG